MTEAHRPNIFERARNGVVDRWNGLRERFNHRVEDFAINQTARNVVFLTEAIPRVERAREFFSGGVREVAEKLWGSIKGAGERLGEKLRVIPENVNNSVSGFREECGRCGVAPTLANRIGAWVDGTAERVMIQIPTNRMDRKANKLDARVEAIEELNAQGAFDGHQRLIDAAARVTHRLAERRDELRTRADEIRESRIKRLREAIDRLNKRPWVPVGVLPPELI